MIKVLEINKYPSLSDDSFGITWEVTSNCTYDCRYCVLHKKENFTYPKETIDLINKLSESKNIILTLFGGEPTSHPDLLKIISELDNKIDLGIFTNLSRSKQYYEKLLELKPNLKFETTYHPSQAHFNEYCSKIQFLMDNKIKVSIAFMVDSRYLSFSKREYDFLCEICQDVTPFKIDFQDQELLESDDIWLMSENTIKNKKLRMIYEENGELHDIESTPGFLWANNLNNFKYYQCDCGKSCFYISSNGDVFPCLDYKKNNLGKFFNVMDDYSSKLEDVLKSGIICKSNQCTSEIDVRKKRILNV